MADAVTWVYILTAATTAVSVADSRQTAKANANAANYNATIAEQNALLAQQNAAANEAQFRRDSRREIGAMRARLAGQGMSMDGSPIEMFTSMAADAELDALTIRQQGAVESLGFENTSRLDRTRAGTARRQGNMNSASAILGGGAQAYGTYNRSQLAKTN